MPIEIVIPRLGWSMDEGILGEWLKQPGEQVHAGDMVFILEGEKAVHEIEAIDAGILCVPADAPKPGETVQVGQIIGFLLAEGEAPPSSVGTTDHAVNPVATGTTPQTPESPHPRQLTEQIANAQMVFSPRAAGPAARRLARQLGIDLNAVPTPDPTGRVICEDVLRVATIGTSPTVSKTTGRIVATPRARRRSNELGIDWRQVQGTGRNGRIRERDVVMYAAAVKEFQPALSAASGVAARAQSSVAPSTSGRFEPASRVRRTIAQRMLAGVTQTAPVTLSTKVDASALVRQREEWKTADAKHIVPSYNDMLVKLAAVVLREQSQLNACWHNDGIWTYEEVHIGVAVETPKGLLAPVIRDADKLTLNEIVQRSRALAEQAQSGTLTQGQLEGGTFTITNLGSFGIDVFTPIINLPQAAILGIGRIRQEPVVRDHEIAVGHTLSLSLTFDHRVIDGAPAAAWLQRFCELITDCQERLS